MPPKGGPKGKRKIDNDVNDRLARLEDIMVEIRDSMRDNADERRIDQPQENAHAHQRPCITMDFVGYDVADDRLQLGVVAPNPDQDRRGPRPVPAVRLAGQRGNLQSQREDTDRGDN